MRTARTDSARSRLALLGLCLCALLASPGGAANDCDRLFPDLSCERQARPVGSVMPVSSPFLFEDPYITTGTNSIGLWQQFPAHSLYAGGDLEMLALQLRLAITERLAFVLTQNGFGWIHPDHPQLSNGRGFFNLTAGFKAAAWLWEGEDVGAILTPSLRYQIPLGQEEVLQDGSGDAGLLIPALSAAYHRRGWHLIADVGSQAGLDPDKSSSTLFYNLHLDRAFSGVGTGFRFLVPFVELNGIHYLSSGDGSRKIRTQLGRLPLETVRRGLGLRSFEGGDLANLGADRIAGKDLISMAWGLRLPVGEGLSFGLSYERPLGGRKDLLLQRVTFMIGWEL